MTPYDFEAVLSKKISPAARNLRTAKIFTINNVNFMDAATPEHDSAQSHEHTHYTFAQLTEMHIQSSYLSTRQEKGVALVPGYNYG